MNGDQLAFIQSHTGPKDERYFAELSGLGAVGHDSLRQPRANGDTAIGGLIVERAADVRPASVSWVWEGRVPLGSLTLLVGQPGLGKSMLGCELAARASRGQLGGDLGGPCEVLYLSAEDSPAHTLVPRLMAAGADLHRVHFLSIRDAAGGRGLTLPDDVDKLADAVRQTGARLVIVDPVMAHLATGLDVHRDHSIRRALAPLVRLADELGVAVLAVAHLNKAAGSDLFARVGGSIGLTAAARSVLVMGTDPEAADGAPDRILAHGKSNLSPLAPALRLRVEARTAQTPDGPIATAGIAWAGEAPGIRISDLLAATGGEADDGSSPRGEATAFLRALLADGPMSAKDVRRAARDAGIADRTLDRAKHTLRVIPRHEGRPGQTGQAWTWSLASKDATDGRRTPTQGHGVLGEDVAHLADQDAATQRAAADRGDGSHADEWIIPVPVRDPDTDEEGKWTD